MSQVRDNLTALTGTIEARRTHPALPGHDEVRLRISGSAPVEGKADLLAAAVGDVLEIAVPRRLLGDAAVGARVKLRAGRGSSGWILAEPDPEPGQFSVS
ncbi:hypothetical protein [Amycolatopsis sp. NPDC004169]|uniref:hypothetical protein n=1 Tax=Amycolatopsis sp. NPDC004169 TaxID=3154453 RepID=UPI0033A6DF19